MKIVLRLLRFLGAECLKSQGKAGKPEWGDSPPAA